MRAGTAVPHRAGAALGAPVVPTVVRHREAAAHGAAAAAMVARHRAGVARGAAVVAMVVHKFPAASKSTEVHLIKFYTVQNTAKCLMFRF